MNNDNSAYRSSVVLIKPKTLYEQISDAHAGFGER